MDQLSGFPVEIICEILDMLVLKDLIVMRLVSKKYAEFTSATLVKSKRYSSVHGDIIASKSVELRFNYSNFVDVGEIRALTYNIHHSVPKNRGVFMIVGNEIFTVRGECTIVVMKLIAGTIASSLSEVKKMM